MLGSRKRVAVGAGLLVVALIAPAVHEASSRGGTSAETASPRPEPGSTGTAPQSTTSTVAESTTTTPIDDRATTTAPRPPSPTTRQRVTTTSRASQAPGTSTTETTPPTTARAAAAAAVNSSHQNVFWHKCDDLVLMSDAELDTWKSRGVGGFVCATGHLLEMGGTQAYTGDRGVALTAEQYERQRQIRSSRLVERLHRRGMRAYFSFYVANYHTPRAPFGDWFDDNLWTGTVLPQVGNVAAMAKLEGFDGVIMDQENYVGRDQRAHSWSWDTGHGRPEAEAREMVRRRGQELMGVIVAAYPGLSIGVYHWLLTGSWQELVQHRINKAPADNAKGTVFLEFFDGLTSVEGYGAFSLLDATFYKNTHLGSSWDTALGYNANQLYATLSRGLRNWGYAASRVRVVPFAWIDHNPSEYPYRAQTEVEVREQLAAFRRWSVGSEYFNFVFNTPMAKYDYSPHFAAMRAGAEPGVVDDRAPSLTVTPPLTGAQTITGSAVDNLAIRSVRWADERGHGGQARLTWVRTGGDESSGVEWRMDWEITGVALTAAETPVTITAEDVKGLTTAQTVTLRS